MHYIKKVAMFLLLIVCMINPTYALNDHVAFYINQDPNIAFVREDEFHIQIALSGTEDYKEIVLKPYEIQADGYYVPLEEGLYVVNDIKYEGKNDKIRESGYGIGGSFEVTDSFCGIDVNVGGDSVKKIIENNAHYIVKQNEKEVGKINELVTKEDMDKQEEQQRIEDEKEKEKAKENKKKKRNSLLLKSIPIILIASVGGIIIFILHKHKKI